MATTKSRKRTPTRRSPANQPVDRIHAAARENALKRLEASKPAEDGSEPPEAAKDVEEALDEGYEPLLDLSTAKQKRPSIRIDGEKYELRLYREFGIGDQHALDRDGAEFDALYRQPPPLTRKEKDRLKVLLDRVLGMVLIAPKTVIKKLDDEQRSLIVTTFTVGPLQLAVQRAAAQAREDEEAKEAEKDTETPEEETQAT